MDEEILVLKAKKGDKKALEKLFQDNYSVVYGYMLKLILDENTAKDFTQEAMLKAILNIKKFKGKSKFSTWLITIATNAYKDNIKKIKGREVNIESIISTSSENLEETIIIKETFDNIKRILLDIPESKRMVFILKHYYNYSYEEISKIVDCPIGTVRSRLHYCIKKIKEELDGGV